MDRSYKIYKSYHTSHHNTTKTHLQISTPPSSVQQRTDAHNLPDKHIESQASKLQASSNAPTLTTSPPNHKETQPFLPAIQRSADGSSNSRESTQSSSPHQSPLPPVAPHPHHYLPPGTEQPGRRVPVGYDSAGGELILGWRRSALFLKSPLSERQQAASSDFLKTVLAEFRQPRSQPPTKPVANRHPSPRRPSSDIRPPPSTTKKERPAAHPARKERSPNFHQLTIIHNHLRSAYTPIRSHQI